MTDHRRTTGRQFGTVTVRPSSARAADGMTLHQWRPSADIARGLPEGYAIRLQGFSRAAGRQFLLADDSPTEFVLEASLGGQIIFGVRNSLSVAEMRRRDFYRLFYQRVWSTRGFRKRRFERFSDLRVRSLGQTTSDDDDVSPEGIGLDERGDGQRWTVNDLIREGVDACLAAGQPNPVEREIIRRGLLVAARRSPLVVETVDQVRALVRIALFAVTPTVESVTTRQVDWVEQEVERILNRHLSDDGETFAQFLKDPKGQLVRRISKRVRTPVGRLTRGQVDAALLEIGWRALESVAECVDAQMQAFEAAIPEPLNCWEQSQFSLSFRSHEFFGNLPLLLISDRVSFLRHAIADVFDDPTDQRRVATMHRMLLYYNEMVGKRRPADRRYKQRMLATNARGRVASQTPMSDLVVEPARNATQHDMTEFKDIVRHVFLVRHLAREEEFEGEWDARLTNSSKTMIEVLVSGSNHPDSIRYIIPRDEFERLARQWRELERPSIG